MDESKPKGEGGEGSDPREVLVAETIENWKKQLPDVLHNWVVRGKDGIVTPEEVFQDYDNMLAKLKKNEDGENDNYIKALKSGEMQASNNFIFWFSPDSAQQAVEGKLIGSDGSLSGDRPFYINSRFNNAWSRMCDKFPQQTKLAIECYIKRTSAGEPMNDQENTALTELALYLSEEEGVVVSFLCL